MKKKGVICAAIVGVILVAALGGWKMGLFDKIFMKRYAVEEEMVQDVSVTKGQELMTTVSSEEEAIEIATLYNIELVSFADGVAVYTTDEPIGDVLLRGKEGGYPELSINFERRAY